MGMPVHDKASDVEIPENQPKKVLEIGDGAKDANSIAILDIKENIRMLEKGVGNSETRQIMRVLRGVPNIRRTLNPIILRTLVPFVYPIGEERDKINQFIEKVPTNVVFKIPKTMHATKSPIPEVDTYFHLLVLLMLIDSKKIEEGEICSNNLMTKITQYNRRTLDLIAAKCYFYHARVAELSNSMEKIRGFLYARLRTATLHSDYEGQAVLLNCLLRNYLHYNLYEQADKLVSKSVFPESASNNEWARFLYYLGRIKAARLEYSAAHKYLVQAMRKAPQSTALGFQQTTQKLAIVVELLLGDIPDRQIFKQGPLRRSLIPYLQLTQAVRMGNLMRFSEVLEMFGLQFREDHTYTLILRLRNNVIKTAIRSIGMAYSRIKPCDIATKLGLDSAEDAEFIVAKAIRDGVIEATIDPQMGFMKSKESNDVYRTREPQLAFHQRISFCLNLHNQSVKAMRFPPKKATPDLENAVNRAVKEQQDLEIMTFDDFDDDDDDDDDF